MKPTKNQTSKNSSIWTINQSCKNLIYTFLVFSSVFSAKRVVKSCQFFDDYNSKTNKNKINSFYDLFSDLDRSLALLCTIVSSINFNAFKESALSLYHSNFEHLSTNAKNIPCKRLLDMVFSIIGCIIYLWHWRQMLSFRIIIIRN